MAEVTIEQVERLLFREARLLDSGRLEEWTDLFTLDGSYSVPMVPGDSAMPAIIDDDDTRRRERVRRLADVAAHSQRPASRTVHLISNVELVASDGNDAVVNAAVVIHEIRPGDVQQAGIGEPRSFAGRCEYRLRQVDDDLKIASKTVWLLERSLALSNFTFVV
jgi:3-phenylpropionate/cinnamic acid dioxygenase small subunit